MLDHQGYLYSLYNMGKNSFQNLKILSSPKRWKIRKMSNDAHTILNAKFLECKFLPIRKFGSVMTIDYSL